MRVALVIAGAAVLAGATGGVAAAADGPVVLGEAAGSYVYDRDVVPAGAQALVHSVETGSGKTIVTLHVYGFLPNRDYGAHAHVNACSADPNGAGGHFQHIPGAANDPTYANPDNEIWLDFTTNASGNAEATSIEAWTFSSDRRPHSVVIHDEHTMTGPGSRKGRPAAGLSHRRVLAAPGGPLRALTGPRGRCTLLVSQLRPIGHAT
jgi:Cu-Zn family superoxide dismutase